MKEASEFVGGLLSLVLVAALVLWALGSYLGFSSGPEIITVDGVAVYVCRNMVHVSGGTFGSKYRIAYSNDNSEDVTIEGASSVVVQQMSKSDREDRCKGTPVTSTTVTQQEVPAPTSSAVTNPSKPFCNADGEQCFATEAQTKEWNCQLPSYSDNGAGLPNVSEKAWDRYCMSTVIRWQDYKLAHHIK